MNAAAPSDLTAGQMVGAGRYTLLAMVASGGTCLVWLARDERIGDTVALKFLQPHLAQNPQMHHELRKEAIQNRRLTHQNIVQLYDIYESLDEPPFLIMEYVEGASLHTLRLEKPGQVFTWAEMRPIVLQLCGALDHAHTEQLIHRDLKPANIMINAKGRLKLADLGISATLNDGYTELLGLRDTRGTLTFMSPQQQAGDPPQPSDDLYALGAMLYELLCGVPPFHDGDISHQLQAVPPQPLDVRLREKQLPCDVPPHIIKMIMDSLDKDPAIRPASVRDFAQAIDANAAAERLFITPPTNIPQPTGVPTATAHTPRQRFSREFYIVMSVLVMLLGVAGVTLWMVLRK